MIRSRNSGILKQFRKPASIREIALSLAICFSAGSQAMTYSEALASALATTSQLPPFPSIAALALALNAATLTVSFFQFALSQNLHAITAAIHQSGCAQCLVNGSAIIELVQALEIDRDVNGGEFLVVKTTLGQTTGQWQLPPSKPGRVDDPEREPCPF